MEQKPYQYGFTLGKFMPPHEGHLQLIAEAEKYVRNLYILVGTLEREPIPGELRFQWMEELNPNHTVIHITDDLPSYPHEHPDFWKIWTAVFKKYLPVEPEVFFCGEDYGDEVAQHLRIKHIRVDRTRFPIVISATEIRLNPFLHWDMIPAVVKPYFVKRIVLTGPESTGKTTLAQKLAEHFNTNWVEEYGHEHFDKVNGKLVREDFLIIARTQMEREDQKAKISNRLLFCDTDLMVTQIFGELYLNESLSWIMNASKQRKYDLFLLMDIDVPWIDDGTREFPHFRQQHFDRLKKELELRGLPYVVVSGNYEERFQHAIEAVDRLMK
ncbi:MAG: AAA family ATPase [Cyclobacteriaceae bacterium]|nr:AAA family ATPase [Cyclobacteriaceae bacterium]